MSNSKPVNTQQLSDLSDQELMRVFQAGEVKAFDLLVKRYQDAIVNYAFRFVGNYEDACDVAQETFLRLFKNKLMYEPIAKFSTWLYTIAGNIAKSQLRKRKNAVIVSLSQRDEDGEDKTWDVPDGNYTPDKSVDE